MADFAGYVEHVRAEDTCGWGSWSSVWSFTTFSEGGGGDDTTGDNYTLGITPLVDGTYSGYSETAITDGIVDPYNGTASTWASTESATASV